MKIELSVDEVKILFGVTSRSLKYMKRAFRQEVVHPRLTREAIDRRKRLYEKLKKALKASEKSVYTNRST